MPTSPGRTAAVLTCAALLALTPACLVARTTVNEPLPRESIARLEPGATTAREVVEWLGAPTDVVQLGRRTAYRYDFTSSKRAGLFLVLVFLLGEDTRSDRLWVFFDENEVLTHFGATLTGHEAEYALPWEKLHEAGDDEPDGDG